MAFGAFEALDSDAGVVLVELDEDGAPAGQDGGDAGGADAGERVEDEVADAAG